MKAITLDGEGNIVHAEVGTSWAAVDGFEPVSACPVVENVEEG